MTLPLGVILAGGKATRMGGSDKALLTLGGQTLLARAAARLGPQVSGMAVSANGDPARYADVGLPVLADSVPGFPGPLAGVLAGLDWAAGKGVPAIVTIAVDTPFFPKSLVQELTSAARDLAHPMAIATTSDASGETIRHPTFGLWPTDLREDLRGFINEGIHKMLLWADIHGAAEARFDAGRNDPFFNINTPADLFAAEGLFDGETKFVP
ncbi:MAG: molybdenum cofactor guanylyltransferase MobA [Roseivivax sp.]|nr:molybdenum cofactor guanylyltransferase MobA [Roseivivax sp.]